MSKFVSQCTIKVAVVGQARTEEVVANSTQSGGKN